MNNPAYTKYTYDIYNSYTHILIYCKYILLSVGILHGFPFPHHFYESRCLVTATDGAWWIQDTFGPLPIPIDSTFANIALACRNFSRDEEINRWFFDPFLACQRSNVLAVSPVMHWQCDGFLGWLDTLDFNSLRRKLARRQRSPKQQAIETFQLRRKKGQRSKDARKMPDYINTPGFFWTHWKRCWLILRPASLTLLIEQFSHSSSHKKSCSVNISSELVKPLLDATALCTAFSEDSTKPGYRNEPSMILLDHGDESWVMMRWLEGSISKGSHSVSDRGCTWWHLQLGPPPIYGSNQWA